MEQATAIAGFGQQYATTSTMTSLNNVSILWVYFKGLNLIDDDFVNLSHASATTELMAEEEVANELALFKTELAIVVTAFRDQGRNEFQRVYRNPLVPGMDMPQNLKPLWAKDMEETLDSVRKSFVKLVTYLDSQIPCDCLKSILEKARRDESEMTTDQEECKHDGGKLQHLSETSLKEMERAIVPFSFTQVDLRGDEWGGTYRDWKALASFFVAKPTFATRDFAIYAYSLAAQMCWKYRQHRRAEPVANLGLLAECCVEHGTEIVLEAVSKMQDPELSSSVSHLMQPYLRTLYADMYKTNAPSSIVRFLQKKIPCECLDDMRSIFHAIGSDRGEVCNICFQAKPKSKVLSCSRCGIEQYCSRACQEKDHRDHRTICKLLASVVQGERDT